MAAMDTLMPGMRTGNFAPAAQADSPPRTAHPGRCISTGELMARDIIRTPNAPTPPPAYSQAVRAAGLVFA